MLVEDYNLNEVLKRHVNCTFQCCESNIMHEQHGVYPFSLNVFHVFSHSSRFDFEL